MSVSLQQPMRPAEIALVKLANANEAAIAQETADRGAADATLQANIDAEASARYQADSRLQSGIDGINAKFPVAAGSIADSAVTSDKIANGTISTIDLDEGIQNQLSFLASVPDLEFGTSGSFDVQASGYYDCTVTFTAAKTEVPIVLCGLQHAAGSMACIVTAVTNQQFTARVFNLTTIGITAAKLDWLAISGR